MFRHFQPPQGDIEQGKCNKWFICATVKLKYKLLKKVQKLKKKT